MTRRHYLLARNKRCLLFSDLDPFTRRLLCTHGRYIELYDPPYGWLSASRSHDNCGPYEFLTDAAYRVSSRLKPRNFREEEYS